MSTVKVVRGILNLINIGQKHEAQIGLTFTDFIKNRLIIQEIGTVCTKMYKVCLKCFSK